MATFQFGKFELDDNQLLRDGVRVELAHRHLRALRLLIEAQGQAVARERLLEELWPGVRVEPSSLHRVMSDLRKALGEREDGGQYIENLARVGYRFSAPVPAERERAGAPSSRRIWLGAAAAGAAVMLGGTVAGVRVWRESSQRNQARDMYVRGRARWWRRTGQAMVEAAELFREAIHIDPRFAPAYSGLADTIATKRDGSGLAWESAEKALSLDPRCAEAYASRGFIRFALRWEWNAAEADLRQSLSLAPDYLPAVHWLSLLQALTGRTKDALATVERGLRMDPVSPNLLTAKASYLYMRREYKQALQLLRETDGVTPGFPFTLQWMGRTEVALGQLDQGVATWRASMEAMDAPSPSLLHRPPSSVMPGEGRRWLEERVASRSTNPALLALYAAWCKRPDDVLSFLEEAVERRELLLMYAGGDPAFDFVRGARQFTAVVAAMNLPVPPVSAPPEPAPEDSQKQSG